MTPGQKKAILEIERIQELSNGKFEIFNITEEDNELIIVFYIDIGNIEKINGGLKFRNREKFILYIPPDFPFVIPQLRVDHKRFAHIGHMNWVNWLCLYQSKVDWNPSDGLYGYFDRLKLWIQKAAINDMDPIEGPLHPPVIYNIDNSQNSFIIRQDIPIKAGEFWAGFAEIQFHKNRNEIIGWKDFSESINKDCQPALAIILSKSLPFRFPRNGKDFFQELFKQGIMKEKILAILKYSSNLTQEDENAFWVLATPMRRSSDGKIKHHVSIWIIDRKDADYLRTAICKDEDTEEITKLRKKLEDSIFEYLEKVPVRWCNVMEDRSEIVVPRDKESQTRWFYNKSVFVLGCGALGSWAAEMIARSNPKKIDLLDISKVNPGLIIRQNYTLEDIGCYKADALARKLKLITGKNNVKSYCCEAYLYIFKNLDSFQNYDIVLDFTANQIFQMKLERDWRKLCNKSPIIISTIIDSVAQKYLCVNLCKNSSGGIWDAYIQLKNLLCFEDACQDFVNAFYTKQALEDLFQPEPGCSDPTFRGSMSDVISLISSAVNISVKDISEDKSPVGMAFSAHSNNNESCKIKKFSLSNENRFIIGNFQVRILGNIFYYVKEGIIQNKRIRSKKHETGGLLWGYWDESIETIWILDASGPPSDSLHDPGHFICGMEGTALEHENRMKLSYSNCGFIGYWHTHPFLPSKQSEIDLTGMINLVTCRGPKVFPTKN